MGPYERVFGSGQARTLEPNKGRWRGANGSSKRGLPSWRRSACKPPGSEKRRAFWRGDTALPGCPPLRASGCRLWRMRCSPLRTARRQAEGKADADGRRPNETRPAAKGKAPLGCGAVSPCRRCTARRAWRRSSSCRAGRGSCAGDVPARPWPRPCTGRPGAAGRRSCCPTRDA